LNPLVSGIIHQTSSLILRLRIVCWTRPETLAAFIDSKMISFADKTKELQVTRCVIPRRRGSSFVPPPLDFRLRGNDRGKWLSFVCDQDFYVKGSSLAVVPGSEGVAGGVFPEKKE